MKRVKFTKFGANSAIGGFAPGDVARVSDALAEHLVNEAGVAKFADAQPAAAAAEPPAEAKPDGKPSDGLKVDEIKAALAAKGIAIPEGVTLKADLAALLDGAQPAKTDETTQ